jgi:hypothetical protein
VVTGGLAWVIGRGGGPLYAFIGANGRILGLTVVAAAGIALMIVFYALLVPFLPSAQRQQLFARGRGLAGRYASRRS